VKVQSHADAKQGQVDVEISNEEVNVIGFFSKHHQGVFTHHSNYTHMHLMTSDGKMMGHVDEVRFEKGKSKVWVPY
jgi:acetolactate decarboxylase